MADFIYLDSNATTRPAAEVVSAVNELMRDCWGNPSSVHRFGQQVRHRIELAREQVARLINADPSEIVFTSGGTESANLAIFGSVPTTSPQRNIIITTAVEHSAVWEPMCRLNESGKTIIRLPVDSKGVIDLDHLKEVFRQYATPISLISIQWANNETGVVQPIEECLEIVRNESDGKTLFHTDATQWVGKMPVDVRQIPVDLMTFSGHKIHGPTGVGVLFVRKGVRLKPIQHGGPHERNRRGGTENALGIVGLGVAAELAQSRLSDSFISRLEQRRDAFERRLVDVISDVSVNGLDAPYGRVWTTSNLAFDRLEAEAIVLMLSERGVCVSAGAACSSGSLDPSPVLLAMGIPTSRAHGSIRFSFNHATSEDELDRAVEHVRLVVGRLRESLGG